MNWIDIVSPRLRAHHQSWMELRGADIMPHLRTYNGFYPLVPDALSASMAKPADKPSPLFRQIGEKVTFVFPGCAAGIEFSSIMPGATRVAVTVPFLRVIRSRQPDCRRASYRAGLQSGEFEQLLLPFGNNRMQVCLIHSIFHLS